MSTVKRFLSLDDLSNMPQPQWLIEGLFERTSLIMLAGPSYSFKSFLLLDWLLCMASGRKWNNRPTQLCKIAYALGEGKSSLIKRIKAWVINAQLTEEEAQRLNENFRVTFEVPQLASKASTDNFLADIEREGFKPEVIAVDTFARSFVGLDENDAKDTGLWVESADRLRQLGYGVIFLHHTKKNTENGVHYRGSTAIIGAMDTAMTLTRARHDCTLKVTKQKDHDEGPDWKFTRKLVPIGPKDESCVLVPGQTVIDERFAAEVIEPKVEVWPKAEIDELAEQLINDETFATDKERAEILHAESGISMSGAISRISRVRADLEAHPIASENCNDSLQSIASLEESTTSGEIATPKP